MGRSNMKVIVATVEFRAADVLSGVAGMRRRNEDDLWFVRKDGCWLQDPSAEMMLRPIRVSGDESWLSCAKDTPRVTVIGLSNHVIKALLKLDTVGPDVFLEVRLDNEDEFCLVLCQQAS